MRSSASNDIDGQRNSSKGGQRVEQTQHLGTKRPIDVIDITDDNKQVIELDISGLDQMVRTKSAARKSPSIQNMSVTEESIQSASTVNSEWKIYNSRRMIAPVGIRKWSARVISASSFDTHLEKFENAIFTKKPVVILKLAEVQEVPDWEDWPEPRAVNLQAALDRPSTPWRFRKAVLVVRDLSVRRRRYANKHYKSESLFIVDRAWSVEANSDVAIMPLSNVLCNTAIPRRMSLGTEV